MNISKLYRLAAENQLVAIPNNNAMQRARAAYRKNIAEPGDCNGNLPLLAGLAIAQADIGLRPGWIPEVQKIGSKIAALLNNATT